MSLLSEAADCLAASLSSAAAEVGRYSRDATGLPYVELSGTPVINEYEVVDDKTGLPTKVTAYDWLFTAAELVLPGIIGPTPPLQGDRWRVTLNGVAEVYEVLPIGNRPCSERHDTAGVMILVHMKKVLA